MHSRSKFLGVLFALVASALLAAEVAVAQEAWPAEAAGSSQNLTGVEAQPEPNDFHEDLSSAFWNPQTRRLWVCRNGPDGGSSKFWVLREDGAGSFVVDDRDGKRGEWTGFGDLEEVTQADLGEDSVYLLIEGEERIKEYNISVYGTASLRNNWNTRPFLPLNGGYGAEGLVFVPDWHLAAAGFVDKDGQAYTSTEGMHGLMFVGHQNGGSIFVFDLNRTNGTFKFIGEYRTSYAETAGLAFDRSTGLLYVWHDDSYDILEILDLTSSAVSGQSYRRFNTMRTFYGPDHRNNEGVAVLPIQECVDGKRSFFMTIDDGGSSSLNRYHQFTFGCPLPVGPDCAPGDLGAWSEPAQPSDVTFALDKRTLFWGSAAAQAGPDATYDVLRGEANQLPVGGFGEACLASKSIETAFSDYESPAGGQAFYYLARVRNACGGNYGLTSGGAPRSSSACP